MCHHGNISAHAPFGAVPFGRWMFQQGNLSTWGNIGTVNFRHMDILAPCKAIWTFRHRHFGTCATVPKRQCAKNSSCRKVPMSKCSRVETSICRNVCSAKWCTCQNVLMMKHQCGNDSFQKILCQNGQASSRQFNESLNLQCC